MVALGEKENETIEWSGDGIGEALGCQIFGSGTCSYHIVIPALQHVTQIMLIVQALLIIVGVEVRVEEVPLLRVSWAIAFEWSKRAF